MCRSSKQEIGCNWWDAFALRMCRKLQYRQESETRPHWEPQPLFAQFTFILFRIEFKPGFGRRLHLPILSTYLPNPRGSKRASATSPPVNTDQTFHPLNSALLTLAERREQGASASASAAKKFWHEGGEGGGSIYTRAGMRDAVELCSWMQNHHLSDKAGVKTRRCLSRSWILRQASRQEEEECILKF